MLEGQPSHTALHVAAARAAHLRFDPAPHLLADRQAEGLLGESHAPMIDLYGNDGYWLLRENRLYVPLRARWVEDRLRDAFARGVRRYVILGAGLDSFALRQPEELSGLEIIEVDHPATQRWKRARLAALGWATPANLTWLECDFERERVSDALARVGFASATAAVVSWMGVVYYLDRSTACQTLVELRGVLGGGSEVLMDYLHPYEDLSPRYHELAQTLGNYLKQVGEPHKTRLRAHEIEHDILAAGYERAITVQRDEVERRYLASLHTDVPLSERFGLAVAVR